MPWQQVVIDASGQVMPCAYRNSYTNFGLSSCGNVNESSLNDIWNGSEYQQLRREMLSGDLDAAGCAKCYALKQGQPLQLEYDIDVAQEKPPHTPYAKNLALKRQEIEKGVAILESTPTIINFTPSHACNLDCIHCYQKGSRSLRITRNGVLDEILEVLPTISKIVAGGGEPLILPFWRKFILSADLKKNPYLRFSTTTNATVLAQEIIEGLKRFKSLEIIVSLDGATKQLYEKIRTGANFDIVHSNIMKFIELVREKSQSSIGINIAVMKDNIKELNNLVKFCLETGVLFNLQPVISMPVDQSLRSFKNPEIEMSGWKEAIDAARSEFENYASAQPGYSVTSNLMLDHFNALDNCIPWSLASVKHYSVKKQLTRLELFLHNPVNGIRDIKNIAKAQRQVIGFFPYQNGRPSWECTHYAEIINSEYEAYLPAGDYAYGFFAVMASPYCFSYTKISIPQMHRSYSMLPMVLYALRILRKIFRENEKNNWKNIFLRAVRGLSRLKR
jgi:radical SAM protein with 4Fe4S-binding SPASM domain